MTTTLSSHTFKSVTALAIFFLALFAFWNDNIQGVWIYPYFSGAANLGLNLDWVVDPVGFEGFNQLSPSEKLSYRFERNDVGPLTQFNLLDRGYVYLIWISRNLFFWVPDMKAIVITQILFHAASSVWVMSKMMSNTSRVLFFILYTINPIVLHFVTFAYLYYWQVVPSLLWVWLSERGKHQSCSIWSVILVASVLLACFFIRQSTFIVSFVILVASVVKCRNKLLWILVPAFLAIALLTKNAVTPWHTAYVGLGAYPNPQGIELSDRFAFNLYEAANGTKISTGFSSGSFFDSDVRAQYDEFISANYFDFIDRFPTIVLKNAALNILQGFSFGHPVGSLLGAYISSLVGLIVIFTLLFKRLYSYTFLLVSGIIGFALYYPPIPAYMFGNYLLLSIAAIKIADPWLQSLKSFRGNNQ